MVTDVVPHLLPDFAAHRRAALDRLAPDEAVLLFGGPRVQRSRGVSHRYRPSSDVYWLTGWQHANVVVCLRPGSHPLTMFVDAADRDEAAAVCGADRVHSLGRLEAELPRLLRGVRALHHDFARDPDHDALVIASSRSAAGLATTADPAAPETFHALSRLIGELRLFKGPDEVALIREAARISGLAHTAAMAATRPGVHEHELEAVLREIFLRNGSTGAGYTPTIASGQNALFRHYTRNRDRIEDGALVLVDAACEVCFYTADLTRTWPASGRFSSPQRDLYEAVLHAQTEAIAAIAPGATQDDVHRTAVRALTGAMIALGLLKGDVDDRIGDGSYRRYYPHPTCHWLGLDVHDVGWSGRAGAYRPMEPGMVLTVEPGLYVPPDDERAPAALRGIGVCIEDDVVVGPSGPEVLSDGVPRTVDEVERACRS